MYILNLLVHTLYIRYLFEIIFQIWKDISIARGLSSEETFKFSSIVEFQGETESFTERNISVWKEMNKNINGTRSETEFTAVEDPLNMHRTASNETTLV